jgi:glutathione synthase/RimK-type ligase-like ATP-grasp enzyme
MAKAKVLIITHSEDNISIDTVTRFIQDAGAEAVRFNVDKYPLYSKLTSIYRQRNRQVILENESGTHELQDAAGVWYRRSYHVGKGLDTVLDKEYLAPSLGEAKRTLLGMLEGLDVFQMEKYSVYRRLDSKEEQLKIAAECGLQIPRTCISNDATVIRNFIQTLQAPAVTKMQSAFAIYRNEEEHVVFTNEVEEQHLENLESVQYCPMVFQEKLEKQLELRITIVGKEIFAFSIDSAAGERSRNDWRKDGVALLESWKPYELPGDIREKLLRFMDVYGLNYGAIDVILTPEGQYYFLEVNAAGEYFWLDKLCDHAISRHIAQVLLGTAPRRGN